MNEKARYIYEWPRPMVTVDAVVYLKDNGNLKFLLIQRGNEPFKGQWAFPGGFVDMDEELHDAVKRELYEETALQNIALTQMQTFGKLGRDPRGRMITITFIGKTTPENTNVKAGDDAHKAKWFEAENLPDLAFDHEDVMDFAKKWIAKNDPS